LKGVGRVYQQTFINTYAKVACAKLYDRKTPITTADLFNDRVLPFFDQHNVKQLRVLTDRGSEYSRLALHRRDHAPLCVAQIGLRVTVWLCCCRVARDKAAARAELERRMVMLQQNGGLTALKQHGGGMPGLAVKDQIVLDARKTRKLHGL